MNIKLPEDVKYIIRILEEAGYEAYAVGGCVRDSILGREPNDWDITTSAKPLEIKKRFRRTIDTGLQHGTVTVLMNHKGYEVTTYRIDGEYKDGRHPENVEFTSSLVEDLKRRDFTINAMAYNPTTGVVDVFHGVQDMKKKKIRCVGDARERFSEDALRMLRAVRFSAQLGFEMEESTKDGVRLLWKNLALVSAERIQAELEKLLVSSHPEYLRTAWELGLTKIFLPEFDKMMETEQNCPYHSYTVGEHTLKALQEIEPDKLLRLCVLLHDVGKPTVKTTDEAGIDHFYGHSEKSAQISKKIMMRLRFDNDTINRVSRIIAVHDQYPALTEKSVRKLIYRVGSELFPSLLKVQKADIMAHTTLAQKERMPVIEKTAELFREIMEKKDCLSLKELQIHGRDLIQDGMKPGKEMGMVLNALLVHVLEYPDHNKKDYLLEYSRSLRSKF